MTNKTFLIVIFLTLSAGLLFTKASGQSNRQTNYKLGVADSLQKQDLRPLVSVVFCINEDGRVSDVSIKETVCNKCNRELKKKLETEALRLVKEMPPFPSKGNGKPKKTWFLVPIRFKMNGDSITTQIETAK